MIRYSDHPSRLCYYCRHSLQPDSRNHPWNTNAIADAPLFDTENCKDHAIKRHYRKPDFIPVEPNRPNEGFYERCRKEDVRRSNDWLDRQAQFSAFQSLIAE